MHTINIFAFIKFYTKASSIFNLFIIIIKNFNIKFDKFIFLYYVLDCFLFQNCIKRKI